MIPWPPLWVCESCGADCGSAIEAIWCAKRDESETD